MKKIWTCGMFLSCLTLGAPGCRDDDPCQRGQTEGPDGLCYLPPNWGEPCKNVTDCTGGLFCAAPELPICTQIDCAVDAENDTVCPNAFTCTSTGRTAPEPTSVCLPRPPTPEQCGELPAGGDGGDGGAGPSDDGAVPNLGQPCELENDPICKGGTVCETEQLHYCVIFSCAEGCKNAALCAAAGFTCYLPDPSPPGGTCVDL